MNELTRHTLAVLVDNEAGVLSRVARLFSGNCLHCRQIKSCMLIPCQCFARKLQHDASFFLHKPAFHDIFYRLRSLSSIPHMRSSWNRKSMLFGAYLLALFFALMYHRIKPR